MKHDSSRRYAVEKAQDDPHAQVLAGVEKRQRNLDWQDTMRNGQLVNTLLWRGSNDATTIQRIGIAIFGLAFLSIGLFFVFSLASELHSLICALFGVPLIALGVRVSLNAFRRQRDGATGKEHRNRRT